MGNIHKLPGHVLCSVFHANPAFSNKSFSGFILKMVTMEICSGRIVTPILKFYQRIDVDNLNNAVMFSKLLPISLCVSKNLLAKLAVCDRIFCIKSRFISLKTCTQRCQLEAESTCRYRACCLKISCETICPLT